MYKRDVVMFDLVSLTVGISFLPLIYRRSRYSQVICHLLLGQSQHPPPFPDNCIDRHILSPFIFQNLKYLIPLWYQSSGKPTTEELSNFQSEKLTAG